MARIIAEAGVRLVADRRGLGQSIRREFRAAIKEAVAGGGFFDAVDRDTDETSSRVSTKWKRVFTGLRATLTSVFSGAALVGKFLLVGTAAAGAVAGVVQLGLAVGALAGAALQAAGVVGLLPAALAGYLVVSTAVKLATQGMGDAFKAIASGDGAAFQEALKNLAPAARDFAKAVKDVKPAFDEMRLDVQQALFEELGDVVRPLAETYLPLFGDTFRSIARDVGGAGADVAAFLLQAEQVQKVGTFTASVRDAFAGLRGAIVPATSALLDIVTTGSTFLPRLTAAVTTFATSFAERISAMAADGSLEAFFNRAIEAVKTLGAIAGNVFEGLGNIMDAARASGGGLLQNIEAITQRFADFTGSSAGQEALIGFFTSMRRVVDALAPAFFQLVSIIGTTVMPIFADIAQAIGPVLVPIFRALGQLLASLRPLLTALADAFATVLAAFEPVIDAFSRALDEAMPQLKPVIEDIGKAFANLVKALAPLAPVFVELIQIVLSMLPPFIQMVADILPSLIELIKAVMPYIRAWAEAFIALMPIIADVANFLLAILVPVITIVANILGFLLTVFTAVFSGIWNVVTSIFGAIADFISYIWNGIGEFFSETFSWIKDLFADGFGGLVGKVGQWFSQIWQNIVSLMGKVVSGVGDAIGAVVDWFLSLPGKIWDAVKGAARWLYDTGRQIIQGLIDGVKSMVNNLLSVIGVTTEGAINKAKSGFGVHSPSTVFREIGINLGQGLVAGIDSMIPAVADAVAGMTTAATGDVNVGTVFGTNAASGSGAAAALAGTVVHQTNVMQPGTDVKQFSDLVLKRGMGDLYSSASTLTVARNGVQAGVNDQWVGV